ncbi:acetate--CoA ligase family protein [Profundibacter amoris]|uniref:CoA-binding protein n=1 Tax=Profundibacter amoris TaxID=2171755 RepID=A0A347UD49_9RHOB|nr:acetate--CoA ligase family protein [Profundibacter amoris]AXX96777.1 CoA-binding protein [Profundibacter amoris]
MNAGLKRLLRPKSIAVIGGGTWCENVIRQSGAFGFEGDIWPVHPGRAKIAGLPTYPDIEALPTAPDAAFIGINRHATIEAVATLSEKGAGGVVCFASGFLEAKAEDSSGANLQAQLLQAAGDMTVIGPNCYGFINALDGALLWPDQQGLQHLQSGVAIITQSSNIAINLTMQRRGLPLAYVVTAGNQAQTGLAEIGMEILRDDRVTALGLHIEGIGDIRALEALADTARMTGKSIVALKVGNSDQARAATVSHTASLAGSAAGASALLRRLGIAQVATLPELTEALKLLHVTGPLPSNHIASLSCSGGEASLMADLAGPCGIVFPALTDICNNALRKALGPMVSLANPLDYHTYIWGDVKAMTTTFGAIMQGDIALGIVVADFPRNDRCDPADWDCVIDAVIAAQKASGKPMAIAASLPENMSERVAIRLIENGIIPLCGLPEALTAARVGAECGQIHPAPPQPVLLPQTPNRYAPLNEAKAKAALAAYGVQVPHACRADSIQDLARALQGLAYPLVLKGEGLAHKSEAGAVVLGLANADQVLNAAKDMPTNSFLVEEMITGCLCELLVGVVLDPAHGYVLTLGAGGVLTELLRDTASLLIPASRADIKSALRGLRIYAQLNGYRGSPAADLPAVIDAVMAIQSYVIDNHGQAIEIEVNPLMCLADDAIAADALIRTGEKT